MLVCIPELREGHVQRREFLASICGIGATCSFPSSARAQSGQRRPRIVWIAAFPIPSGPDNLNFNAHFLEVMAGLGYVRDRDFAFEVRAGHGLATFQDWRKRLSHRILP